MKKKNKKKRASQEKRSTSWKPERAVRVKINQWRISTEKLRFRPGQSCNQEDIPKNSKTLTNGLFWKSSWDQFDKRAHVFICLDICSHFHLSWYLPQPCMFWALFFSKINHYFLFSETLLEIHNRAFMHYCKRFRGQWKRNS